MGPFIDSTQDKTGDKGTLNRLGTRGQQEKLINYLTLA